MRINGTTTLSFYVGRTLVKKKGDENALRRALLLTSYLDPIENRPGRRRLRYRFAGVWQVVSQNLRIELISRGLGVGYLPEHLVEHNSSSAVLHHISRFEHSSFEREIGLYYSKRRKPTQVASEFIDFCDEHFAQHPMS